jgi:hypothetical protein
LLLDNHGFGVKEIVSESIAIQEAWVMATIKELEGDEPAILPDNAYELILLHRSQRVNLVEVPQKL